MGPRRAGFPAAIVLVLAVSGFAGTTGSLTGMVIDDQGLPLTGANITISSPALIGVAWDVSGDGKNVVKGSWGRFAATLCRALTRTRARWTSARKDASGLGRGTAGRRLPLGHRA